jgi:hypothetical protein
MFGYNKLDSFEYHGIAEIVVFFSFRNSIINLSLFVFLNHGFAH